jgi:hypothetical protein
MTFELDAYYSILNGFTCDERRYTPFGIDPKEVYGEDFPRLVRVFAKHPAEIWTLDLQIYV